MGQHFVQPDVQDTIDGPKVGCSSFRHLSFLFFFDETSKRKTEERKGAASIGKWGISASGMSNFE